MVTGRKLLLADDSVTIQKVIDLTFSDEGIEVTTVGNGEQALSKLDELQPDIVLADIFMPGRSGYEVCEHIKRDERYRHIPVMLLVGSFEPFDEAEARRVGADDYLTKPFQSIRQLVSKVTALISGGGAGSSSGEASTQDLELPPEVAERMERERAGSDLHTADTAPLPQELEDRDPAEVAAHLAGHESLDDELIEARRPGESSETTESTPAESRPTAPLSFADLKEAGIRIPQQEQSELHQESDTKAEEMNDEPLTTEPRSTYMKNAAAADEALLDLGDIEPPVSATEADEFILDLQDDAPAPSIAEPAQQARGPWSVDDSVGFSESEPSPKVSDAWSSDPQPIVEAAAASSVSDFAQHESAASPQSFNEEMPSAMPEHAEAAASGYGLEEGTAPESFTTKEPAAVELPSSFEAPAPTTSQITLDQLSPEAIETIARRAVELLSSKVVEQVAWEVVPQLAELLIKRKLEEEKTQ